MIWRIVERNIAILLTAMIILDLALFVRVSLAERRLQSVATVVRPGAGTEMIPPPSGFRSDGTRIDLSMARKGWAVRYAGESCPFCAKDTQWNVLANRLQDMGIEPIVLLPSPQDEFRKTHLVPEGIPQEAYVDMEWVKHFRLTMTPTLLLFDNHQRLIWQRQGMLDPSDTSAAIKAVSAIR
jgi:hypothetical protein